MKYRYILLSVFFFGLFFSANTQTLIPVPYLDGFETPEQRAKWRLNHGPQGHLTNDQWVIGRGARTEGQYGLYIATDSNEFVSQFGHVPNVVVAYREFSVPRPMQYNISFDWRTNIAGGSHPGAPGLYVLLLSTAEQIPVSVPNSAIVSPAIVNNRRAGPLNDQLQWQNHSFDVFLPAGPDFRLVFVWVNNNTNDNLRNPIGASIDNIQITSNFCARPTNLTVDASNVDTIRVSWTGTSPLYELEFKPRSDLTWSRRGPFTGTSTIITDLPNGSYDFRVRGICDDETSAWLTKNSVLVYCPERSCLNFIDIHNPALVTAFHGTFVNPQANIGIVDYGEDDIRSRHTVVLTHADDPLTGNRLPRIPDDAFASIRLGNWASGAQAESLVFHHYVDSTNAVLLLRYAAVLQNPPSHGYTVQPRFRIEILDQHGNHVDPSCGVANFVSGFDTDGWEVFYPTRGMMGIVSTSRIVWRDWTTMGLNLTAFRGQQIQIRLTTWDCQPSAHFGYAYFILNCVRGEIQVNSCGDGNVSVIRAPDGFRYEWFKFDPVTGDSIFISHAQEIDVLPSDTITYFCRVSFIEDPNCYFILSTVVYPRFPISQFSYTLATENCQNIVRFRNESYIMTMSGGVEIHNTDMPVDEWRWDFGENYNVSFLEHPELIVPSDGDTIHVTLRAFLANRQCYQDTTIRIVVPPIGVIEDTVIYDEICWGGTVQFGDRIIGQSGRYYRTIPSLVTGCDSTIILELIVHPTYSMPAENDTICFGEGRWFIDRYYYQTERITRWLTTEFGCDSVVVLDLYVRDEIRFEAVAHHVLAGPNSGMIELRNVSLPVGQYSWSLNGVMNTSLTGLSGGEYTIVLYNQYGCASVPQTLRINQDRLEVELMNEAPMLCGADDSFELHYRLVTGWLTVYNILFDEKARSHGFVDVLNVPADESPILVTLPANARPNEYGLTLVFEDLLYDENFEISVPFTVHYSSNIIQQRWNNLLFVLNAAHNDGFEFSAFQWYKNDELIIGATSSYLHVEEGLDMQAEYRVELTRVGENFSVFTCPVSPYWAENAMLILNLEANVAPTMGNFRLNSSLSGIAQIYSLTGILINEQLIHEGQNILQAPDRPGYYLLRVALENQQTKTYRIHVLP